MAVYAIGDVQGCYKSLRTLLDGLRFDPSADRLWFTGDLVNRGPDSLAALRFVKGLGDSALTVLGNHDLHLLAVATDADRSQGKDDTLQPVLDAPDADELLAWLRHLPLLHHAPELSYALVHAGLPPQWDLSQALDRAQEVETVLRGDNYREFLQHMYGDRPDRWSDSLQGLERLRFITNCLTRLRYCKADGTLCLHSKGPPGTQPEGQYPWFECPGRRSADTRIIFGHWSTLGLRVRDNICALDTGCLWGGELTAMRLDGGGGIHQVMCPESVAPG